MLNYNNLTKEELVKLIAGKDPAIVQYIYEKYSPAIYGVILEKTKFRKDADGILVETFVEFFNANFSNSSLQNSIFINLHNTALNCIKKDNVLHLNHPSANISHLRVSSKT
jgi:DNA-directed RNA polymerase specialized sigma24 family protein